MKKKEEKNYQNMTTSMKVCNFSCSCIKDECLYKHRIDNIKQRKEFKELVEKIYDRNNHNETDPEGKRNLPCINGYMCKKEECGYKHRCSFNGRKIIQKEWEELYPRPQRKQLNLEDANQLKKLIEKYEMNEEEIELIDLFTNYIRRS